MSQNYGNPHRDPITNPNSPIPILIFIPSILTHSLSDPRTLLNCKILYELHSIRQHKSDGITLRIPSHTSTVLIKSSLTNFARLKRTKDYYTAKDYISLNVQGLSVCRKIASMVCTLNNISIDTC